MLELLKCDYIKSNKNVIIVGDFNFPGIDWSDWTTVHSENHISYKFIELLRDNFMHQHVVENTRFRFGQNPSLLDLIISNEEDLIENVMYRDKLGASDHIGITFEVNCRLNVNMNKGERSNFFKGDYMACRDYLNNVDWSSVEDKNVHDSWDFILLHINHCIDHFIPVKRSKTSKSKPKWMNHYCVRAVKKKYHAWKRFTFSRSYRDYEEHCKLRNRASKAVLYSKKKHGKLIAESAKVNPKSFWGYVREQTKTRSGISDLKNEQGEVITDDTEKAQLMNSFFASVFTDEDTNRMPDLEDKVSDD